jgi:hypothetical protein
MRHKAPDIVSTLCKYERPGIPIGTTLNSVICDPAAGWRARGAAAKLLSTADSAGTVAALLDLFYAQTDRLELWETALTIGDRAAVPRLIEALYDTNPDRRHAAARALGWIRPVGKMAAKALTQALLDKAQPQPVREEAAESLAYSNYKHAIPALITVLDEPDVRIRFWSVFALGGIGQWQTFAPPGRADPRAIEALERMLPDQEVPPGNWWPVGREALAMLGKMERLYEAKLADETRRVLNDPNSSREDLRWAQSYSH